MDGGRDGVMDDRRDDRQEKGQRKGLHKRCRNGWPKRDCRRDDGLDENSKLVGEEISNGRAEWIRQEIKM